jgi:hypothetical protein
MTGNYRPTFMVDTKAASKPIDPALSFNGIVGDSGGVNLPLYFRAPVSLTIVLDSAGLAVRIEAIKHGSILEELDILLF